MTIDSSPAARRAFRKRVLAASAARHPRAIARPNPPSGIEQAYTKILRDTSRAMDDAIMAGLRAKGVVKRGDAVRDLEPEEATVEIGTEDIGRITRYLTRKLATVASYGSLAGAIDKMASRLVDYSRSQWQAQLKSSLGINLAADPDLSKLVERFRDRQTKLITSLATDKVQRVKDVLRDLGSNARVETIADQIAETADVTMSRARLIARTETTTFNAQLSQARHVAAGITQFTWSTSRDERVRPSHREMDGKTCEYAKLPIVEGVPTLPGAIYNCRCTAIAVIPEDDT